MSADRAYRLWRRAKLQVPRKRRRRRVASSRPRPTPPTYGPEFVSRAILSWLSDAGIDTALIDPGKPWQNGTNESFNDKFRNECLSLEWFRCRAEAVVAIEAWRRHYDGVRPHSSLGDLTPSEFRTKEESAQSTRGEATFNVQVLL